jgi:ferrochelatase
MDSSTTRIAVVLFNLGGPLSLQGVRPFLFNLFKDPAIVRLPSFIRVPLAFIISFFRSKSAIVSYQKLGGKSPLLSNTRDQAIHLEKALGPGFKTFVVMRYAFPRADEVIKDLLVYTPHKMVLLPLYPQYSTTTTASSFKEWMEVLKRNKFTIPTLPIYNYWDLDELISFYVDLIKETWTEAQQYGSPRLLLTAHGLPLKIVEEGDLYPQHVQKMGDLIVQKLNYPDHVVCYQSRVGPMEWLKPYIKDEISKAALAKTPLIIVPISFVSEHIETLVELDEEYKSFALGSGVPYYKRIPTPQCDPVFISGLKRLVLLRLKNHSPS